MNQRDKADRLQNVLLAASALLEARRDQMVTSQEWDDLQYAVDMAVHGRPVDHTVDIEADEA